jgi:hypothetical protein
MMATRKPRTLHVMLLGISIVFSLVSLAILVMHPEGTGSLRMSLNVLALILVIAATTMLARAPGGDR